MQKKQKVLIGFNEKMSHFLTNMNSCSVLPKKISDLIEPLQNLFYKLYRKSKARFVITLTPRSIELSSIKKSGV